MDAFLDVPSPPGTAPASGTAPAPALCRRSPTLVVYWQDACLFAHDYALHRRCVIDERDWQLLAQLTGWVARPALDDLDQRLDRLVREGLVETSTSPIVPERRAASVWAEWSPEAAFFHFGTKDGRRLSLEAATKQLNEQLAIEAYPETLKTYTAHPGFDLPPCPESGVVPELLRARRTWRRFGDQPLALEQLSTLLGLTWGVQHWMRLGPEVRSALKTSPSGGACHSIEAYVVARQVEGVAPGLYHYHPDQHRLTCLQSDLPPNPIVTYLGGQPWYADCSALILMTSVIPRVRWKYRFARAYRTVLLEAGHQCQTFCLLATSLGLAPFCTAMFADSIVEHALGIDGVEETVVYAAGVGPRPEDSAWEPMPAGHRRPRLEPPSYRLRKDT